MVMWQMLILLMQRLFLEWAIRVTQAGLYGRIIIASFAGWQSRIGAMLHK